jgi:hypothetical protein
LLLFEHSLDNENKNTDKSSEGEVMKYHKIKPNHFSGFLGREKRQTSIKTCYKKYYERK